MRRCLLASQAGAQLGVDIIGLGLIHVAAGRSTRPTEPLL